MSDRVNADAALVRRLIAAQFPKWAELPIRPVDVSGWDNHTFRLGDDLSVRLPSAARYAAQVDKEQRWLPGLAAGLPLPIPLPLARGAPDANYPWPWSIYRWLPGDTASPERVRRLDEFANDVAQFLRALERIESTDGPLPGPHNFFRGGPLATYDAETRQALGALEGQLDTAAALSVWETALGSTWSALPVWVHGDMAASNLLVVNGRLSAVIDFGSCGVGDPACDLAIAWTLFQGESRNTFRKALPLDPATWARARGWTLWKALITLVASRHDPIQAATARRLIQDLITKHRREP
jgi:aminoglycoside phosphotransferase (APT) family kinase protein